MTPPRSRRFRYPTPALAVDGVLLRKGAVLLIRRGHAPFEGHWAFPGGFVELGERAEDAVVREILEETGLRTRIKTLVGFYSDPDRDPRGHVASAVYLLSAAGGRLQGGDDAREAAWWPLARRPPLAFDHEEILEDALRCRARVGERKRPGRRIP